MRHRNCFVAVVLDGAAVKNCSQYVFTTRKLELASSSCFFSPSLASYGKSSRVKKCQQGFLMPLALFVLLAMAALAIAITRFGASSFSAAVQETMAVQTLYAAESGAQYALNRILYNTSERAVADSRCNALVSSTLNFNASSLTTCSVEIDCNVVSGTEGNARVYRIQSDAQCGNGNLVTFRRLEVAANY